jgi:peptide deformylase
MPVRPVVRLPAAVLKQRAVEVEAVGPAERALAADLVDTMRASPACVGLAAPQIGVGVRAFVLDVTGHAKARTVHGLVVMFNPVVVSRGDPVAAREGCMSVPDLTGDVVRSDRMVVHGLDAEGRPASYETDAFEARAFQHEIDHLDGLLFLDRVESAAAVFRRRVYR